MKSTIIIFVLVLSLAAMSFVAIRKATSLIIAQQIELEKVYQANEKLYKQNLDLNYRVEYYKKINEALEGLYVHRKRK